MTKTHPYHIIEVDCKGFDCKNGIVVDPDAYGVPCPECSVCNGTGKRRRAIWLSEKQPDKVEMMDINRVDHLCAWYPGTLGSLPLTIPKYIKAFSSYQSHKDLPTGETLEEVELKQAGDTINPTFSSALEEHRELLAWTSKNGVTNKSWLCTAILK